MHINQIPCPSASLMCPSMPFSAPPEHFGAGFIPLMCPCCTPYMSFYAHSMSLCAFPGSLCAIRNPCAPIPYHFSTVYAPSHTLLCTLCANSMSICIHSGPLTCPFVIPYVLGPNPSFSMTPARNGSTRTSAEEQSLFTILIPSG